MSLSQHQPSWSVSPAVTCSHLRQLQRHELLHRLGAGVVRPCAPLARIGAGGDLGGGAEADEAGSAAGAVQGAQWLVGDAAKHLDGEVGRDAVVGGLWAAA